jgi:hypothetical protein
MVREVITGEYLQRVHIGLDYFDASINRVAAWVIGARNVLRAALVALLEPTEQVRKLELMKRTFCRRGSKGAHNVNSNHDTPIGVPPRQLRLGRRLRGYARSGRAAGLQVELIGG